MQRWNKSISPDPRVDGWLMLPGLLLLLGLGIQAVAVTQAIAPPLPLAAEIPPELHTSMWSGVSQGICATENPDFVLNTLVNGVLIGGVLLGLGAIALWCRSVDRDRPQSPAPQRDNDALLSLALKAAKAGIWQWDQATNQAIWSEENYRLLGYDPQTVEAKYENWLQAVHPDDRAATSQHLGRVMAEQRRLNLEYRVMWPDGTVRWLADIGEITNDPDGNTTGMIGIQIDITERKQAELALAQLNQALESRVQERTAALQESESRFRQLAETIQQVFWLFDPISQQNLYVSPAYEQIWGQPLDTVYASGWSWADAIHPDDRDRILTLFINSISWEHDVEFRVVRPDGAVRWIRDRSFPIVNELGQVYRVAGLAEDITERKQLEAELEQTRVFLKTVINHLPVAVFVKDGRAGHFGEILLWNQTSEQLFGLTAEQAIGKTVHDYFPKEQADFFLQKDREAFERGTPEDIPEEPIDSYSLGRRLLHTVKVPLYDAQRQPEYLLCFSEDITERKRVETALQDREERLRLAMEAAQMGVWEVNLQTGKQLWSPQSEAMWGFAPGTFDGQRDTFLSRIHADDLARVQQYGQMAMQMGHFRDEYRIVLPNHTIRWIACLGKVFDDGAGHPQRIVGIDLDITDRKRAETDLRVSEERLRLATMAAKQGIYDLNVQTGAAIVTPEYAIMLGYDPDTFQETNAHWIERLHPADRRRVATIYHAYVAGEIPEYKVEFRQRTQSGDWKWILSLGKIVEWDGTGQPLRMLGTHTDISDRKFAEQQLSASLKALDNHFDNSLLAIIEWGPDRHITRWSKQAEQIFGWTEAEIQAMVVTDWQFVYEEDFDRVASQVAVLRNGSVSSCRVQNRNYRKDGTVITCEWNSSATFDDAGNLLSMLSFAQDITDRQRAETDLRASETRFRNLATHLPGMVFQNHTTVEGGFTVLYASSGCHDLYEVPAEAMISGQYTFRDFEHPADRPMIDQMIVRASQLLQPFDQEFRIVTPSGTLKWIQVISQPAPQADGSTIWDGIVLDISDRKQAEIALQESEQRYRAIVEDQTELILRWTPDRTVRFVNNAYCRFYGVIREDFIGQDLLTTVPASVRDWLRVKLDAMIRSLTPEKPTAFIENWVVDATGQSHYYHFSDLGIFDADGRLREIQTVGYDITDRKGAETALQESETRFRQLAENIQEVFWMADVELSQILYVSPAYETIWGRTCASLYENPASFLEAMHPEYRDRALALIHHQRHQGWEHEYRIIQPDGSQRWVWEQAFPVANATGQVERLVGICQDISDRKQAEQQLQNLVEATAATTGPDFFPALVSHMAQALNVAYALVTEEVEGTLQSLAFWAHGVLQPTFIYHPARTPCEWALRDGKFYCECLVQQLFPQDLDLVEMGAESYLGIALQDTQGRAIGNLCILHTQRIPNPQQAETLLRVFAARATAELERSRATQALEHVNRNLESLVDLRTVDLMQRSAQLEAINKELESFSYSVSHDLRAPLRHVNGFVNALQQRLQNHGALADPKVIHYLQVIENSSQKMAQLIDGLLSLSRLTRKPIAYAPVPLRELVDEAIALAQNQTAPTTPVEFVIGELPTVQGDATLLQQVLSNLIANAVKFSRHQPVPQIAIGTLPDGTLFVRDNGVGFQMEYADKLFGAFQRLHAQAEFEGTGIGLAIVQRIIHRHGGTIWAESQVNQGATFYFNLEGV